MRMIRSGMVANAIPRISSVALRGKPNGSHDLTVGSLVPAGLYLPRGFLCSNTFFPACVNTGGSPLSGSGTADPEPGPAHDPEMSRFGAGPPSPFARSAGSNFQTGAWASEADANASVTAKAMTACLLERIVRPFTVVAANLRVPQHRTVGELS